MTIHTLAKPVSGSFFVTPEKGQPLGFDFDHTGCSFTRDGNNLTISFENDAIIVVESFFDQGDGNGLPSITLADGSVINGVDFLISVDPGMDLSTAAGPGSASFQSSGLNTYTDEAGSLLGGVDSLDALGKTEEERAAYEAPIPVSSPLTVALSGPVAGGGAENGVSELPGAEIGTPRDVPYSARAVLYRDEAGRVNEVAVTYIDTNGNLNGTPGLSWVTGDGFDAGTPLVTASFVNGSIVFSLTEAGKAFFADPANADSDYLEAIFRVTDAATGEDYNVQVLVPRDPSFDSSHLDGQATGYGKATEETDLIHGEWHQGNAALGGYDLASSNLDDEILFTGDITGSAIRTGHASDGNWGNDSVTVQGVLRAESDSGNRILAGNGDDTIVLGGMHSTAGGLNTVDTGNGLGDKVTVIGGSMSASDQAGLYASGRNAENTVTTAGTLTVVMDGGSQTAHGIYSHNYGVNEVSAADITVDVQSDTRANGVNSWKGTTRLSLDDPSGTVTVNASSDSGTAYGTWVREKGSLEVDGNYATSARSDNRAAYGLVGGKYDNTVSVNGTLASNASSVNDGSSAIGVAVNSGGTLVVEADATDIEATSVNGLAYGIYGDNGSLDTTVGGLLSVDVASESNARGIYAKSGGLTLNAGDVALSVSSASNAWGLYANDSDLAVNADIFNAVVTGSSTASVYGMHAQGENGNAALTAESVEFTVSGKGGANGMDAGADSENPSEGAMVSNTIIAGNVTIDVSSEGTQTVAGMYAHSNPDWANTVPVVNSIQAGEGGSIIVTITASNMGSHNAYAMRTTGDNASNEIVGGDRADLVDLRGMVWGNNRIDTGDGDDVIRLDGRVDGLELRAGEGADTLILQADDVSRFNEYYAKWLGGMSLEDMREMGIESICISTPGGDATGLEGLDWLVNMVNAYNDAYGLHGSISQGDGISLSYASSTDVDTALAGFTGETGIGDFGHLLLDAGSDLNVEGFSIRSSYDAGGDPGHYAGAEAMGATFHDSGLDEALLIQQIIQVTN